MTITARITNKRPAACTDLAAKKPEKLEWLALIQQLSEQESRGKQRKFLREFAQNNPDSYAKWQKDLQFQKALSDTIIKPRTELAFSTGMFAPGGNDSRMTVFEYEKELKS